MAPFASFLRQLGAPLEAMWSEAGLPLNALLEGEALVPLRLVIRFTEKAARRQGIPDLGVRATRRSSLLNLGTFGRLIAQSATLGDAFATVQRMVSGFNSGASYWLAFDGAEARLSRRFGVEDAEFRQADLMTVAMMADTIGRAAGEDWQPKAIDLQSAGPDEATLREAFPEARIRSGRPATSVVFPRVLLARPFPPPPIARRAMPGTTQVKTWLSSAPPRDFARSIEVILESLLAGGRSDVVTTAAAAGMSVRSFQRTLAQHGLRFSSLLQRTRFAVAERMLGDPVIKIIDVAYQLGYRDPAHFTRAFRQWTSQTPIEYRRMLLHGRQLRASGQ